MFSNPLFTTVLSVLTFLALCATIVCQILEMKQYLMF